MIDYSPVMTSTHVVKDAFLYYSKESDVMMES